MPAATEEVTTKSAQSSLLVGRTQERILLRERFTALIGGQGGLVLIGGEAGIGKTTLAEALGREATAQGALALTGRCYTFAETAPYGLWIELLRHYPEDADLPPLPEVVARCGTTGGITSQADLFARIARFLRAAAARRPLVLILDDLHCADRASLDLLGYLVGQVATIPALFVATYRPNERTPGHPLATLLPVLLTEAHVQRLNLPPLADDDVRTLVGARYRLPSPDEARLATYLRERADGSPFFVGELLRALEEEGLLQPAAGGWTVGDLAQAGLPPRLRQVIAGRVARLGDKDHAVLALAATIGQEVPLALWGAVAEVGEETLLAAIERAVAARLLEETAGGAGVRFVHGLIREALYEGTTLSRRRAWHRRIGEALTASRAPDSDRVAYHFQQAGDARAVEWLAQAGARSQRAYAWLVAAERFEAALALMEERGSDTRERGWLLVRLARMRRYDDSRRAVGHLAEAVRLAVEADDRVLLAYARFYLGLLRCFLEDYSLGLPELEAGVAALDRLSPADRARVAARDAEVETSTTSRSHHGTLAVYLAVIGRHADALAAGRRALADPAALAADGGAAERAAYADAHYALGLVHAVMGRPDEARAAYAHARELYRAARKMYLVAVTAAKEQRWVLLPYRTDAPAEWRALAAEAEEALGRACGVRANLSPRTARLPLLLLEGAWTEARELALAVYATKSDTESFLANHVLGMLAHYHGDRELARALVRETLPAGPETAPGESIFTAALAMQRLAAMQAIDAGDLATARAWLAARDRWLAWGSAVLGRAEGELAWAVYHRAAGDPARAYGHARASLARATAPRQPLSLLFAHQLLGQLDTDAGRPADAAAHLDAALALADACGTPYGRAITLLALAALRLRERGGNRAAARALVDEARGICVALGAAPTLAQADALAARLGKGKPPRPTYPAGLSAREVEVLRLIAAGQTNKQIADALFLSEKTVINHVTHILDKTNTENRAAAAVFAVRHGLA